MKTIIFDIIPIPKPRMVRSDTYSRRPAVMQYWAFKDELNLLANAKHYRIGETLEIIFIIPVPNSWSKKRKEKMVGLPHQQKPDIDNLVKAFMDALSDEDSSIWYLNVRKQWGLEGQIKVFVD